MKKEIKSLEKTLQNLREIWETMEEKFHERSDKWQESENGIDFYLKMNKLDSKCDDLDCLIDELKEI